MIFVFGVLLLTLLKNCNSGNRTQEYIRTKEYIRTQIMQIVMINTDKENERKNTTERR